MAGELVVEVHHLVKRFGRRVTAVDGLDLAVRRGQTYGLLGPNGAGKTTTIRMLLGLVRPDAGTIRVLGGSPGDSAVLRRTGTTGETAFYPFLSGRDNLRAMARRCRLPDARITAVLDVAGLTARAADRVSGYSLGMRQRLALLPGQYVPAVLNRIGLDATLPGTAAFFLIGALAAGTAWDGGTIKTTLLQAPSRVRATLGQALAVAVALVASVALTFAAAGGYTLVTAVTVTGSLSPAAGPLPGAGRLAAALGAAVLVSLSWGALGWAAGTVLRSAAGAFAVILLWTTILQGNLDYYANLMPRAARAVYDVLPNSATDTATLLFGQVNSDYGGSSYTIGEVAPALAFAILAAYALAFFALPVLVTRRRDIN